ncbi:MAG: DUF5694 domain-containing protein [Bacteroidota bacterium]
MNNTIFKFSTRVLLFSLLILFTDCYSYAQEEENEKAEIIILGTLHFSQFHDPEIGPKNFLGDRRKKEFENVVDKLSLFEPDLVLVERKPSKQSTLDSLFTLQSFDPTALSDGLSEVYQIGFPLAKRNQLETVYGVDYYESVSQSLLSDGENINLFKEFLADFRNVGRSVTSRFLKGELSISEFLEILNKPDNVEMSHRLFFNIPAYVKNGSFSSYEGLQQQIDTAYAGAEFISLFYERNLKIYSNIINTQLKKRSRRIVLIIGQTHVGVLENIFENNPSFHAVSPIEYLRDK